MRIKRVAKGFEGQKGLEEFRRTYIEEILGPLARNLRRVKDHRSKKVLTKILKLMKHVNKALRVEYKRIVDGGRPNREFYYSLYSKVESHYNGGLFHSGIRKGIKEIYPLLGELKLPKLSKKEYLESGPYDAFAVGMEKFVDSIYAVVKKDAYGLEILEKWVEAKGELDNKTRRVGLSVLSRLSRPGRLKLALACGVFGMACVSALITKSSLPQGPSARAVKMLGDSLGDLTDDLTF